MSELAELPVTLNGENPASISGTILTGGLLRTLDGPRRTFGAEALGFVEDSTFSLGMGTSQ